MDPNNLTLETADAGDDGRQQTASARRRSTNKDKMSTNMSGTSLHSALAAVGGVKDVDDSDGGALTVFRAFVVSFCIAFGAGIALVGWYPKLAGTWGFAFVITVVSISGGIAENALHVTAIRTGASSFSEMCVILPNIMSKFTSYSMIVWGYTIAALYVKFIFTFINAQFLNGTIPLQGVGALQLYLPIGFVVYFITLPPKFSGSIVKWITNINLATTWVVIVTAIAKGIHMVYTTPENQKPKEYESWKPDGFIQVTVLLAGAMFQCSAVPRLQFEIIPEQRERAAVMIPLFLALVQGVVFLVIGLIGYWALGDCIGNDGDVFNSYNNTTPDNMVFILQAGIALLMFLSLPLLGVPPKSELWALIQAGTPEEDKVAIEDTSATTRCLMNLIMVVYATLMPPLLGPDNVTSLVTVLAGTAANWLNLFLPSFVNLYANILPARAAGEPYGASSFKSAWIFALASICFADSLVKIYNMITGAETAKEPLPGYCECFSNSSSLFCPADPAAAAFFG